MSDSDLQPYPWQHSVWQSLIRRLEANRLPHALLFTGAQGLGQVHLATLFAQRLLCDSPNADQTPCGHCRGCHLFHIGNHPDFLRMEPEEEGKSILVNQIRELAAYQSLKSQYGAHRVIILTPAHRMNPNAANALLKTLEEPNSGTLLILCSERPMSLLATIRSRCQIVQFPPAETPAGVTWLATQDSGAHDWEALLAMSGHAPLTALELVQGEGGQQRLKCFEQLVKLAMQQTDAVSVAQVWQATGSRQVLTWFYSWIADMVRLRSLPTGAHLSNPDLSKHLQGLAERVDLSQLFQIIDRLIEAIRQQRGQLNEQLLLEDILLQWDRLSRKI